MKNHVIPLKASSLFVSGLAAITLTLTGCAAGMLAEEATLIAARSGFAAADLAAAETMIGAEAATIARAATIVTATGALMISNEAINPLLGKVHLEKVYGEPPKLYMEGKPEPFAEVHTNSGRIKILGKNGYPDKYVYIPTNIFSVEGSVVNVRATSPSTKLGEIVSTVRKGDLVVKLAEEKGWYQIRAMKESKIFEGWINSIYLLPLVVNGSNGQQSTHSNVKPIEQPRPKPKIHNCAEELTGDYSFINKTSKTLTICLFSDDTPSEYLGNPGMGGNLINIQANSTGNYFNLPIGIYKYTIKETFRMGGVPLNQTIDYSGNIKVETCKSGQIEIQQ